MALIYSDTEVRGNFSGIDIYKMNPHTPYLHHFENSMYLSFMLANGTTAEKIQASKELKICERKMAFWRRHPMFIQSEMAQKTLDIKKKWEVK